MQFKDNKKYQCAHCFCVAVIKYLIYLIESSKRGAVDLSSWSIWFRVRRQYMTVAGVSGRRELDTS